LIGISVGSRRVPDDADAAYLAVLPTYPHAVSLAGGTPVLIPLQTAQHGLRRIFDRLDGIVISGGGDVSPACYGASASPYTARIDASRDEVEMQLARWAVDEDKPLLAICRGIQVLNVALGGTLIQDIRHEVPNALRHDHDAHKWFRQIVHDVTVEGGSRLHAALGARQNRYAVNSLHHQALAVIAGDLSPVARADDGIIEGVEMAGRRFVVGVQWHPEALVDDHPSMRSLFESFVRAAC
jgi:putative glutamine amidotransferase